jgi:hypothetical protein
MTTQRERAAAKLREYPSVFAVGWGRRRRAGQWIAKPCLVAHVRWKHDPPRKSDWLPRRLDGFDVDVIEAGLPQTLSNGVFDHGDRVRSAVTPLDRRTTPTILQRTSDGIYGLVSGHGSLRLTANGFEHVAGDTIELDDDGIGKSRGDLLSGAVDRGLDFAYAQFDSSDVDRFSPWHLAAGTPPVPARLSPLSLGEELMHFSRLPSRRKLIHGTLNAVILHDVELNDGHAGAINLGALYEVARGSEPFALPGDSGSLVVDAQHRAVGVVVGNTSDTNFAFVMSLTGARVLDATLFALFFEEENP